MNDKRKSIFSKQALYNQSVKVKYSQVIICSIILIFIPMGNIEI